MIPVLSGIHSVALGMAFDPDHARNGFFYVTYLGPFGHNRVSRLTIDPRDHTVADELVLIEGIPASDDGRNGGVMVFGEDRRLYVATGDAGQPAQAQNLISLSGKIIRLSVQSGTREIWARGLRDPRRLEVDSFGTLVVTDRGSDGIDRTMAVSRGANLRDAPAFTAA